MKKLRTLVSVLAMMSMAAVLTGCGDDDDSDDDDNNDNPPVTRFAPANVADLTASAKTYTVNVAGQEQMTLRFPSSTTYELTQGGVTETGSISEPIFTEPNTWNMNLTPAAGQDGSQPGSLALTWTGTDAGTWIFTPEGGQAETGTFTVGGGDPDPDPDPNPQGTNDLTGRILQFTYSTGGDKFTFTSPTAYQWEDNTATGTYQYDSGTGIIRLDTQSRGERFDATIPPNTTTGSTTVDLTTSSGTQSLLATYTWSGGQ
jgi:hypothetical protein